MVLRVKASESQENLNDIDHVFVMIISEITHRDL